MCCCQSIDSVFLCVCVHHCCWSCSVIVPQRSNITGLFFLDLQMKWKMYDWLKDGFLYSHSGPDFCPLDHLESFPQTSKLPLVWLVASRSRFCIRREKVENQQKTNCRFMNVFVTSQSVTRYESETGFVTSAWFTSETEAQRVSTDVLLGSQQQQHDTGPHSQPHIINIHHKSTQHKINNKFTFIIFQCTSSV